MDNSKKNIVSANYGDQNLGFKQDFKLFLSTSLLYKRLNWSDTAHIRQLIDPHVKDDSTI